MTGARPLACLRVAVWPMAVVVLASPLAGEPWTCHFTVECITGEGCAAGGYDVDVIAADHEGQLFASTVAGDTPLTRLSPQGALPAAYASTLQDGLSEFLTIRADRTATLSAHFFSGVSMAATYFGTCEELT